MKLLTIQFEDTVSTVPFTIDSDVTVSNGEDTISGKVMAKTQMAEPPSIDGDYHIKPV